MGDKIALVTAVEKYSHKNISAVDYAEADAKSLVPNRESCIILP
jgi:hypothetical protein